MAAVIHCLLYRHAYTVAVRRGLVSAATRSGDSPPSHAPTRATGAGSTGARAALQGALPVRQLGREALGATGVFVLPPELRVARAGGHHLPQHRHARRGVAQELHVEERELPLGLERVAVVGPELDGATRQHGLEDPSDFCARAFLECMHSDNRSSLHEGNDSCMYFTLALIAERFRCAWIFFACMRAQRSHSLKNNNI
eukprot:COSAG05_NODE_5669_length_1118_cov_14.418057_2_plen_199_part_00